MAPPSSPRGTVEPGRRRCLKGEWLLLAGSIALVVAALAGAETLLRLTNTDSLDDLDAGGLRRLHTYSEVYGWELRKGFHAVRDGVRITINAQGYRGREHPLVKRNGQSRILVLGDSLAFGFEMTDEQTFPALLESALPGADVLNLAVPGWGTDQELIRLEREGLRLSPDVVVLAFCLDNDFIDNSVERFFYDGVHPKPYFRLQGDRLVLESAHLRLSPLARLALLLRERSLLYNTLAPPPVKRSHVDWQARKREALRDPRAAVELTFRLIARMEALTKAQGARFLLLVFPDRDAFHGKEALLGEFSRSSMLAGTDIVDMTAVDRAHYRHFRDFTLDSLGHLNREGHRLTAETLRGLLAHRESPGGRLGDRGRTAVIWRG